LGVLINTAYRPGAKISQYPAISHRNDTIDPYDSGYYIILKILN